MPTRSLVVSIPIREYTEEPLSTRIQTAIDTTCAQEGTRPEGDWQFQQAVEVTTLGAIHLIFIRQIWPSPVTISPGESATNEGLTVGMLARRLPGPGLMDIPENPEIRPRDVGQTATPQFAVNDVVRRREPVSNPEERMTQRNRYDRIVGGGHVGEESFLDTKQDVSLRICSCSKCGRERCLTPMEKADGMVCAKCHNETWDDW